MNSNFSPLIPLTLISVALLTLAISELHHLGERAEELKQQRDAREKIVEQSKITQRKLEDIANGLLDLAPEDAAARALVEKHQIQRIDNAGEGAR